MEHIQKICNISRDKHFQIGGVLCNTYPEKQRSNGDESNKEIEDNNPPKNLLVLDEDKDEDYKC